MKNTHRANDVPDRLENTSKEIDDSDLREYEERRELLHEVTQDTRFNIIQTILMHPKQSPSLEEATFMHPDRSRATIREHLEKLENLGIVAKRELPKDEQSRDLPKVFYGLTSEGRDILDDFGLLDIENTLQYLYQNMEKNENIQKYEKAPRPAEFENSSSNLEFADN